MVDIEVLRVSGTSKPNAVAGAVAALLRTEGRVELQAIGPQAVNQAVKALAIARGYVREDGIDLIIVPSFVTLELHDQQRTALRFLARATDAATDADAADASAPSVSSLAQES